MTFKYKTLLPIILLLFALARHAFCQTPVGQNYTVTDLGTLGGSSSIAWGINSRGQIVGDSYTSSGQDHAFLYQNGVMQDLGTLGGQTSQAPGIDSSGQVAGWSDVGNYFGTRPFLFSNGSMRSLYPTNIWGEFYTYGMNDSDNVVGSGSWGTLNSNHPFLYSNGSMTDLGTLGDTYGWAFGINDANVIVGATAPNGGSDRAFVFSNGSMQRIGTLGGSSSDAYGINANNQIVGQSTISSGYTHAFLYQNGVMQDLGTLGGSYSQADGINDNGQVVGFSYISGNSVYHAFMYSDGVMQDLNSLLINPKSRWTLQYALFINDAGQIVGQGINPSGQQHAFLLNPLPLGAIQAASTVQTALPTYGSVPTSSSGKDSLIFITHGWINPGYPSYATIEQGTAFVDSMSNSVVQYLANNGLNNWQVCGFKWSDQACYSLIEGGPAHALHNANQLGKSIGDSIVQGGWTQVHFIAHSAGAGLIQKATEEIKATSLLPVTIQCTFLDAYDGAILEFVAEYGYKADWADSYFSRDLETGAATQQPLFNAYNVDVTTLDPQAAQNQIAGYVSSSDPSLSCYKTESSHGWPIDYYLNTIDGNVTSDYYGFGFPLSEEAGNWDFATNQYSPGNGFFGNGSARILGPEDPACIPYVFSPEYLGSGTSSAGLNACSAAVKNGIIVLTAERERMLEVKINELKTKIFKAKLVINRN